MGPAERLPDACRLAWAPTPVAQTVAQSTDNSAMPSETPGSPIWPRSSADSENRWSQTRP